MVCQNCGYEHSHVVATTHDQLKTKIQRRRECLKCGVRFTTQEKLYYPAQQHKPQNDKV